MIKINGVDIATPKTYEATVSDLDGESNRNANGELIRDRIAVKRKLNLEWGPLKQSEIQTLLNAVSSVFFTVTFPDPQSGIITKTMYVGDRTAPAYMYDEEAKEVKWQGLKMNFIEK
ncbi:DUF6711 family protein [Clostridium nigeriense]|uniref:DUF6711 family protein n=1 Tax=Clostridium nigeriense TaxID=1805470 RepID=UPI003D33DC76